MSIKDYNKILEFKRKNEISRQSIILNENKTIKYRYSKLL